MVRKVDTAEARAVRRRENSSWGMPHGLFDRVVAVVVVIVVASLSPPPSGYKELE